MNTRIPSFSSLSFIFFTFLLFQVTTQVLSQDNRPMEKNLLSNLPLIQLETIRELQVEKNPELSDLSYVAAASGLVMNEHNFYVVADDELFIAEFENQGICPGTIYRILEGQLPLKPKERKKQKPDFELLVSLSASHFPPYGALMAIPSGSTSHRSKGVIIALDAQKKLTKEIIHLDFSPLYQQLTTILPELNIEGGVVVGQQLVLLQRGNGSRGENALIKWPLNEFLKNVSEQGRIQPSRQMKIEKVTLPSIEKTPLSFNDATVIEGNRILFIASAEAAASTYFDGEVLGSILGIVDLDGKFEILGQFPAHFKAEGLAAKIIKGNGNDSEKQRLEIYLVTDSDSRDVPAKLYRSIIESPADKFSE